MPKDHEADGPVVIVDCKGDMALFNTACAEAERAGSKFEWFTNRPGHSTYVFNPLIEMKRGLDYE